MKMQKFFFAFCAISGLIVATQAYADTAVNIQNQTAYCGQVSIKYGPEAHPTWNVNNLPFVSKSTYQIGHINDTNNFPDYVLGGVQLQLKSNCKDAHFTSMVNCKLNVIQLPDSFMVNVISTNGSLTCTAD